MNYKASHISFVRHDTECAVEELGIVTGKLSEIAAKFYRDPKLMRMKTDAECLSGVITLHSTDPLQCLIFLKPII